MSNELFSGSGSVLAREIVQVSADSFPGCEYVKICNIRGSTPVSSGQAFFAVSAEKNGLEYYVPMVPDELSKEPGAHVCAEWILKIDDPSKIWIQGMPDGAGCFGELHFDWEALRSGTVGASAWFPKMGLEVPGTKRINFTSDVTVNGLKSEETNVISEVKESFFAAVPVVIPGNHYSI